MDHTEDSVSARPSNARVSQACQRCRSLKTRCLLSERPGTCQRCFAAKRDCVWAETARRPRRVRGPSRIQQVEQKIDALLNQTKSDAGNPPARTQNTPPITTDSPSLPQRERRTIPGSWLPFSDSFEQDGTRIEQDETTDSPAHLHGDVDAEDTAQDRDYFEKIRSIHNFGEEETDELPKPSSYTRKPEPAINDPQVKELLSNGEADRLLNAYRSMCITFPFVPTDDFTSAAQLHAAKPMLFLAILTVASWEDHKLQRHLDRVYRKELAHYTFIRPRRTIALLQSVLVYLSRYHFLFSHKTQQIYFLQTTANGLALDLGLHQKSPRRLVDILGRSLPRTYSVTEQLERQRTFLGCYYLSSLVAGGLQRPNLLKYTEYMGQCSRDLRLHQQYPSDAIIGHLLTIRRLDDQIQECFFTEETIGLDITDPRISMSFRLLESQLDEWKRERYDDQFKILFDLSYVFTDMQLHSVALRPPSSSPQTRINDGTRLRALLATLEACKRYFDTLLAFPVSEYHILSLSEWFRIPCVVITLARLCIPTDAHNAVGWDVKVAHERGRLDLYLESLCYRMKGLSTYKKTQNFHVDFYWALEMIMNTTRAWFMKKIEAKKAGSNGIPTPDTGHSFLQGQTVATETFTTSETTNTPIGCPHVPIDADFDVEHNNDPFAFMRDVDFDMDQFFDAGLWGDETYIGMGFGGGMR